MLEELRIQGFALLDDIAVRFTSGLNVLSGETGAGKSLLLTALDSLLGARVPVAGIRDGHDMASVEARFGARSSGGLPLRLSRVVRRSGRGTCLLGDEAVPLRKLAEAARAELCFALQHAHIDIGNPALFLSGLDQLAGHAALARQYSAAYSDVALARSELSRIRAELMGRGARLRLVHEELALLEQLAPQPGEHARLTERLNVLRRAQQYLDLAGQVEHTLSEREGSVGDELSGLLRSAARLSEGALAVRAVHEALSRAAFEIEEAVRAAQRIHADLEIEPQDLEALEARFGKLDRTAQALGIAGNALCERLEALRRESAALEGADERVDLAEAELAHALERALALARDLHAGRTQHAAGLARRIEIELGVLCMSGARLELVLNEARPADLGPHGTSLLEARFAANPGEPLAALADVASGGERSRLLVALRCAGIETGAQTLVFDEIDSGVGGAAAEAVAARLRRAAESRQIICVTHQACVAARAASHFRVHKVEAGGRVRSEVEHLSRAARVDELVRMVSGTRSENARRLALDLLNAAQAEGRRSAA